MQFRAVVLALGEHEQPTLLGLRLHLVLYHQRSNTPIHRVVAIDRENTLEVRQLQVAEPLDIVLAQFVLDLEHEHQRAVHRHQIVLPPAGHMGVAVHLLFGDTVAAQQAGEIAAEQILGDLALHEALPLQAVVGGLQAAGQVIHATPVILDRSLK